MLLNIRKKVEVKTTQWIYHTLKENIIEFILIPGTKLSENGLAKKLNVSRTPIREALSMLIKDKLIEVIPRSGTFVTRIKIKYVYKEIFYRIALETEVMTLISEMDNFDSTELESIIDEQIKISNPKDRYEFVKLDEKFHECFFSIVGMRDAWNTLNDSVSNHNRIRYMFFFSVEQMKKVIEQHKEEIALLKRKDKKEFRNFIRTHTSNFKDMLESIRNLFPNFLDE